MSELKGKRLRYLIGADHIPVHKTLDVIEVGYDVYDRPFGASIKYVNLFDEYNTGEYGPYLKTSDTAQQYNEGQIDPKGAGWNKNLTNQFSKAKDSGFKFIELDNPDAYHLDDVIKAIDLAETYGLRVIAKNPGICEGDQKEYVRRSSAIIVEKDAGTPTEMNELRDSLDKPVWFVSFGNGLKWAEKMAKEIKDKGYENMYVTYSSQGEYKNSKDVN